MKAIYKRSTALVLMVVMLCGLLSLFSVGGKTARYSGYGDAVTYGLKTTETVTYTNREESYIETVKGAPKYSQISQYPNSCGPVAGANIVGFYDKYYEELIPNYTPVLSSGKYRKADTVYIPNLMGELYTLMRTNVDDVGVSETDCLNGLRTYVQNKGRSLTYTNIYSSNQISESAIKSAINNNRPSLVFCNSITLHNFFNVSNTETIEKLTYEGGHIVVAYGLLEIKYYSNSGLFRTDKYLAVSTGLELVTGYLKLDNTGWCNAAYAVTIS